MRAASKRRGVEITSISRPIRPSDFRDFDIILAMDKQNRGTKNAPPPLFISFYNSFDDMLLCLNWALCRGYNGSF